MGEIRRKEGFNAAWIRWDGTPGVQHQAFNINKGCLFQTSIRQRNIFWQEIKSVADGPKIIRLKRKEQRTSKRERV